MIIKKSRKQEITDTIKEVMNDKPVQSLHAVQETCPHLTEILKIQEKQIKNITDNKIIKINDLYKYLGSFELLTVAHRTIYKNKGSATKNTNDETVDGTSDQTLLNIKQLIDTKTFEWSPIRRVEIPRENKKPRKLGISNYTDKLIQFIINLILNAIFEPLFNKNNYNHGFRPEHSTHNCIIDIIDYKNQGLNIAIEGDINSAFDNVKHSILIGILKKYIEDMEFIDIINKGCKAQIIKFNQLEQIKEINTPQMGTPQGYINSPTLFNIYMHDFDEYINNKIKQKFQPLNAKRKYNRLDPYYNKYNNQIKRLKYKLDKQTIKFQYIPETPEDTKNIKKLKEQIKIYKRIRQKLPAYDIKEKELRFFYTRYADDFIILTNADVDICKEIITDANQYLEQKLHLQLNIEKTKITELKNKPAKFLGFAIYMSNPNPKYVQNKQETKFKRREGSMVIKIGIDFDRRNKQLIEKGYASLKNNKIFPACAKHLTPFTEFEIVEQYNQIMQGIANYYFRLITNKSQLNSILYILYYSCLFTIASKRKSSTAKIYKQDSWSEYDLNGKPTNRKKIVISQKLEVPTINGEQYKHVMLEEYKDIMLKSLRIAYNIDGKIEPNPRYNEEYWKLMKIHWRTQTTLPKICIICGTTEHIEMHHTNALKKTKSKKDKNKETLYKFLSAINRKQIPLCKTHHQKVHKGEYNEISLQTVYDERLPRISNFLKSEYSTKQKGQINNNKKYKPLPKLKYHYNPKMRTLINPYVNKKYKKIPKYKIYITKQKNLEDKTTLQKFIIKYFKTIDEFQLPNIKPQ
jgi:RNA-directed DNA polymerase